MDSLNQPQQQSFPPPGGASASVLPPSPDALLNQMLKAPFPSSPYTGGKKGKKKGLGKLEGKRQPSGLGGQLQKASDILTNVINQLGKNSDISVALSGIVRNIDMQVGKLQGFEDLQGSGLQPLGVGTPGQGAPQGAGGIQTPANVPTQ